MPVPRSPHARLRWENRDASEYRLRRDDLSPCSKASREGYRFSVVPEADLRRVEFGPGGGPPRQEMGNSIGWGK